MKPAEIRKLSIKDIENKIKELKMNLLKLRVESSVTQIKNPLQKRNIRKDIARLFTILREKKNAEKKQ